MQQQPLNFQLQKQLSSLTSSTWQQQIQIIQSLPNTMQIVKFITQRNYAADVASLLADHNPRSKLVTTLTQYLTSLFELHCSHLVSFANLLITNDCLVRLLASGNKVVASSANELIKCIISNTNFKEKGKQVKFVKVFEDEFIASKNSYVREKISLYFQFISTSMYYSSKEELREFEGRIVKAGLEDAVEKVRKNMRKILQNIQQFQKENQIEEVASKRKPSYKALSKARSNNSSKPQIKEQILGQRVVFSSVNHSSILQQNFKEQSQIAESKVQRSENAFSGEQLSYNNFMFYLQRIDARQTWAMIQLSYQTLVDMISHQGLTQVANQQLYCQVIKRLTPFLSQKRSRMFQSCCFTLCSVFQEVRRDHRLKVKQYIQEHSHEIIQHASKIEQVGDRLLPFLIQLSPQLFIFKIAQMSTQLKSPKEKIILLDSIIKNSSLFFNYSTHSKSNKKVSSIVRMMCQHITTSTKRDKDIALAALAVISQFKSRYCEDVLMALLCQNDKTLTTIIELADTIDKDLKASVFEYIQSLKGERRGKIMYQTPETITLDAKIASQIQGIKEQKTQSLHKLGELCLTHLQELSQNNFINILGLLQFLCSQDLIMSYRFLISEIAQTAAPAFISSLLSVIQEPTESTMTTLREHHDLFFIQMLIISIKEAVKDDSNGQIIEQCGKCLAKAYREERSLKIRNKCIEGLTYIDPNVLMSLLKQNQLQLVLAYQQKMQEESFQQ